MSERSEKYNKLQITSELIEQYLQGRLDGKTMHSVERQALDDHFLAEALEGFSNHNPDQSAHLADLKERLNKKLGAAEKKSKKRTLWIRYRNSEIAAAAILLLLIGVGIFFFARKNISNVQMIANNRIPKVHLPEKLPLLPKDSGRPAEISTKDSNVSQEVAVNAPNKITSVNPMKKETLAREKENVSVASQRLKNNPDTLQVVGYSAERKESITGSVTVIPSPAMAASADGRTMNPSITIKNKKINSPGDSVLLTGRIRGSKGQQPLTGVTVFVPGTHKGTVTNSAGEFRLPLASKPESLRLAYVGYQSREIAVTNPAETINVRLKPSNRALNEVVVVGYGAHNKRVLKNTASPEGGPVAFRKYIRDSLRYPAEARRKNMEGVVKLSFMVMPDSSLRQIKVIERLGNSCDSEAVRLLREGPLWIPAKGGKPSMQTIRIRFSLPGAGK